VPARGFRWLSFSRLCVLGYKPLDESANWDPHRHGRPVSLILVGLGILTVIAVISTRETAARPMRSSRALRCREAAADPDVLFPARANLPSQFDACARLIAETS